MIYGTAGQEKETVQMFPTLNLPQLVTRHPAPTLLSLDRYSTLCYIGDRSHSIMSVIRARISC